MGNAISSIARIDQKYNPLARFDPGSRALAGLGGDDGRANAEQAAAAEARAAEARAAAAAAEKARALALAKQQFYARNRQMGSQYQYGGAPPQIQQGMMVTPLAMQQMQARQGMGQQFQPQQFQPNWDVNAYNPNQNMQMRQQQMQSQMQPQMRGTPYQNMGMFGAFNPYMPRQR